MAEQIKFGDRLFLAGETVIIDNGTSNGIIDSKNGTLEIRGNLIVQGTSTTVNSTTVEIEDPHMLITGLSSSVDGYRAGIEVERDNEPSNARFSWDETNDWWTTDQKLFSPDFKATNIEAVNVDVTGVFNAVNVQITGGNIDNTIIGATTPVQANFDVLRANNTFVDGDLDVTGSFTTITTDGLNEGSTNLYYTDDRVDARIDELFDAGYGISATDPTSPGFSVSFDAANIGNGEHVLDETDLSRASFRTLKSGLNNDITLSTVGDEIVIDTTHKINHLEFNTFTGNGSTSLYTLPYTVSQDWQVLVYIDGVVQEPTNSYTVSGNQLTVSAPIPNGSVMNVIKMATNTQASSITDAQTLNGQQANYYLDYNNLTNTPTIPSNVSELTNDSGYLTNATLPTNYMVTDANNVVSGSQIPSQDATYNLGSTTEQWNVIYGHAVEATYADLAERYASDAPYEPGTVVVFGGEAEITLTDKEANSKVVGVISTDPALKMNSTAGNNQTHPYVALKGRVPCKVVGKVEKGDLLVTSSMPGYATPSENPSIGTVIGKAIEDKPGLGTGVIEIFVSMM